MLSSSFISGLERLAFLNFLKCDKVIYRSLDSKYFCLFVKSPDNINSSNGSGEGVIS